MGNYFNESKDGIVPMVETGRLKVAVIGSCVTRDCFNSKFNPDWRKYFHCDVSAHQNSIISLVSMPCDTLELDLENLSGWEKNGIHYECRRQFWADLEVYQPDVIVVDLFSEVRFPIIEIGESYITDNCWRLGKSKGYSRLSDFKRISLKNDIEKYLEVFSTAITLLREKILEICPKVRVVLNATEAAYRYIDGDSLPYFDGAQVSEFNRLWGLGAVDLL